MSNVSKQILEDRMQSINKSQQERLDNSTVSDIVDTHRVATTSKVGTKLNQTVGGVKSLTQSADDTIDSITDSRPIQQTNKLDIAQITNQLPGLKTKFGDQRQVRITAASPEAISFNAEKATSATPQELQNVLRNTIDLNVDEFEKIEKSFESIISEVVSNASGVGASIISDLNASLDAASNNINSGFPSLVENIVEQTNGNSIRTINGILVKNGISVELPPNELSELNRLIASKDFRAAARQLEDKSDLTLSEIENRLKAIDNRISSNTNSENQRDLENRSKVLDDYKKNWDNENTKSSRVNKQSLTPGHKFTLVTTHEELEVELKSISREITEVIFDWTATFKNQNIGSEELHQTAQNKGNSIGYHYVIKKDGSLQRGRPSEDVGKSLVNNHHLYSVQVVFVGGINAPVGNYPYTEELLSSRSLTSAQLDTYKLFLDKAYDAWPGVQVLGMNDIDTTNTAPGFDVGSFIESEFNKKNVYTNTFTQKPFTRDKLIKQRVTDNG